MRAIYYIALIALIVWGMRLCSPGNNSNIKHAEVRQVSIEELGAYIDELKGIPTLITGRVAATFYIGIADGGFYIIEDDSGNRLTVTTRHRVTPAIGEVITVIVIPKVLMRTNAGATITAAEYRRVPLQRDS